MVLELPAIYDRRIMARGRAYNRREPMKGTFGWLVYNRRWNELGLSQQALADRITDLGGKMAQGDVSDLEHGKTKEPRLPRLDLLAQALNLPFDTLVEWAKNPLAATVRQPTTTIHKSEPMPDAFEEEIEMTAEEMALFRRWQKQIEGARKTRSPRLLARTHKIIVVRVPDSDQDERQASR